MAATIPMTLQDILDEVYVAVDNDPTSSITVDDEQTARIRLCNMAIKKWEGVKEVFWNELWATYTHAATVSTATTYIISATDYRFAGSYMKFTLSGSDAYLEIVKPEEAFKYALSGSKAVYITGNPSAGWTINLTWTPASGDGFFGATMSHNYYKSATRLSAVTDKPEMPDPSFIVNFVSYRKNLYNGRSNVASDYRDEMQTSLDNMVVRNAVGVNYSSSEIADLDIIRNNASLGI